MPVHIAAPAIMRVSDQRGRTVRQELLAAGTDLRDRLRIAYENFKRDGWQVGDLRPGQWAFVAEKPDQRLMVAIKVAEDAAVASMVASGEGARPS
jgi:hypothetical protein